MASVPSRFYWRPMRSHDVPRCLELFRADGARGALLDERLMSRLVSDKTLIACIFEELAPRATSRSMAAD